MNFKGNSRQYVCKNIRLYSAPSVTLSTRSVFLLMALIDRWSTLAISTFIIQFNVYSSMWDKYKSTNHLFDDIIKNLIITTAVAKKRYLGVKKAMTTNNKIVWCICKYLHMYKHLKVVWGLNIKCIKHICTMQPRRMWHIFYIFQDWQVKAPILSRFFLRNIFTRMYTENVSIRTTSIQQGSKWDTAQWKSTLE